LAVGRLIDKKLKSLLQGRGFVKETNSWGFTLYVRRSADDPARIYHAIVFERTSLSPGLRVFLCINCLPIYGADNVYGPEPKRIEAPCFSIVEKSDEEGAVDAAGEFLARTGLSWFDDPYAMTPGEWRERHDMVDFHDGHVVEGTVSWPADLPHTKAAVLLTLHVDDFKGVDARELLPLTRDSHAVRIRPRGLAQMLELRKRIASAGLGLHIDNAEPPTNR